MADKIDYYELLGVERTATDGEISSAYRMMAIKYHPDKNPGDDDAVERFKMAAEAFEVLNDVQKRATYDRFGHQGLENGGGAPGFHDVGDIFEAFGDLFGGGGGMFGDLFGGGGRRGGSRVRRGGDIRCEVELDLLEAAQGTTKNVRFDRHAECDTCGGNGCKKGTEPEVCQYCGGRGRVTQSTGIFSIQTTCPQCRGQGRIIRTPCPECRGSGLVGKEILHEIKIPAGVDTGTRLRLQGEGEKSFEGGPAGDCYVFITVKEHNLFQRDGQNLILRLPIGYAQAALGATIEVPTLEGRDDMKIWPGTQHGDVITMRGKGMPIPRRKIRGDLLVQVLIEVPRKLTPEHETALRELAEIEHANVSPERSSFVDKIKDYFSNKSWLKDD